MKPRKPRIPLPLQSCRCCGKEFSPYREWQLYCSARCRSLYHWLTHEVIKTELGAVTIPISMMSQTQ
jgi:hypothetical protein